MVTNKIDFLRLPTRTIYQPYASAVFEGMKHYETAIRRTHIRGQVYIHAASTLRPRFYVPFLMDTDDLPESSTYTLEWLRSLPLGAILGTVEIVDCVSTEEIRDGLSEQERAFGNYGDGRWAYVLANPTKYPESIPVKGKQGWWYFDEAVKKIHA